MTDTNNKRIQALFKLLDSKDVPYQLHCSDCGAQEGEPIRNKNCSHVNWIIKINTKELFKSNLTNSPTTQGE